MHDLVIRGGTLVDGTGNPARVADIAVDGGLISEIGKINERGRTTIDASDHVVSPGFIDGHTHMDAQMFWDPMGESSCWNGVTTAVMGNCGFTLAPSRIDQRDLVVRNLERAEDISREAMLQGISWGFETFPEYLDAIEQLPMGINYGAQVGHSSLRTWAMGDRAFEESATDSDLEAMRRQLQDAMSAGALGFTTSRSDNHETSDDRQVASRLASWNELVLLVNTAGRFNGAMFELALESVSSNGTSDERREHAGRMISLAKSSQARIMFGVVARSGEEDFDWREKLQMLDDAAAQGGQMFGQTHCRGISIYTSFGTHLPFDGLPEWKEFRARPLAEQAQQLENAEVRARLVAATDTAEYGRAIGVEARPPDFDTMIALVSPVGSNPTVADLASARRQHPVEVMIDLAVKSQLAQFFVQPLTDTDPGVLLEIMRHPRTVMTFSDAGAHVSQISDACLQTAFLAEWVRNRAEFTLEHAVKMITSVPAQMWGLAGRGVVRDGFAADLNVFDPSTVGPAMPRALADLPGGATRIEQRATGIMATIVGGQVSIRDGEATGVLPGKLVRRRPNGDVT